MDWNTLVWGVHGRLGMLRECRCVEQKEEGEGELRVSDVQSRDESYADIIAMLCPTAEQAACNWLGESSVQGDPDR